MLVPKGLEGTGTRAAYTRASYMSGYVEDTAHLHKWEMRYLAKAMGQNEDLAALAACERYSTGISDAVFGREKTQSGRNLDDIIERALDRVRIHEKADRGTAVHGFTEPAWWAVQDHDYSKIPERLREPVAAFWAANKEARIEILGTEMFVANDITMTAGTFDHSIRIHGDPLFANKIVVGDKKTGKANPFEWSIQMATYAYGEVYDTETDTRRPWPGTVDQSWGFVWQIDCEPDTKFEDRVKFWIVDLEFGWEMLQIAAQVRDAQNQRDVGSVYTAPKFKAALEACQTPETLRILWESTTDLAERALVEEKARSL